MAKRNRSTIFQKNKQSRRALPSKRSSLVLKVNDVQSLYPTKQVVTDNFQFKMSAESGKRSIFGLSVRHTAKSRTDTSIAAAFDLNASRIVSPSGVKTIPQWTSTANATYDSMTMTNICDLENISWNLLANRSLPFSNGHDPDSFTGQNVQVEASKVLSKVNMFHGNQAGSVPQFSNYMVKNNYTGEHATTIANSHLQVMPLVNTQIDKGHVRFKFSNTGSGPVKISFLRYKWVNAEWPTSNQLSWTLTPTAYFNNAPGPVACLVAELTRREGARLYDTPSHRGTNVPGRADLWSDIVDLPKKKLLPPNPRYKTANGYGLPVGSIINNGTTNIVNPNDPNSTLMRTPFDFIEEERIEIVIPAGGTQTLSSALPPLSYNPVSDKMRTRYANGATQNFTPPAIPPTDPPAAQPHTAGLAITPLNSVDFGDNSLSPYSKFMKTFVIAACGVEGLVNAHGKATTDVPEIIGVRETPVSVFCEGQYVEHVYPSYVSKPADWVGSRRQDMTIPDLIGTNLESSAVIFMQSALNTLKGGNSNPVVEFAKAT